MRLGVHLPHPVGVEVHIDLGRGNIGMAHHLLYGMQIRAVLHQMRRKGVADGVGRDLGGDPGLSGIALDQLPEALAAHGTAGTVGKQRIAVLPFQQNSGVVI